MSTLSSIGQEVHAFTVAKGWWNDPLHQRIPRLLDWLIEEVGEAEEAWGDTGRRAYTMPDADGLAKPEGLPSELADLIMIILDVAEGLSIDLEAAIATKFAYNRLRRFKRDAQGTPLPAPQHRGQQGA